MPDARVTVDRYMKLMRSTSSNAVIGELRLPGPLPWSTYVHTITATESATRIPAVPARVSRVRRRAMNASGQNRYQCSSTARLQTWRSSGGSPL